MTRVVRRPFVSGVVVGGWLVLAVVSPLLLGFVRSDAQSKLDETKSQLRECTTLNLRSVEQLNASSAVLQAADAQLRRATAQLARYEQEFNALAQSFRALTRKESSGLTGTGTGLTLMPGQSVIGGGAVGAVSIPSGRAPTTTAPKRPPR